MTTKISYQTETSPRIRFNWGYHNAAQDCLKGRPHAWACKRHPDPAYKAGYSAGYSDAKDGKYSEDSTDAWLLAVLWEDVPAE